MNKMKISEETAMKNSKGSPKKKTGLFKFEV